MLPQVKVSTRERMNPWDVHRVASDHKMDEAPFFRAVYTRLAAWVFICC